MSLTKVSFSMITGAPINVLDYGADPTGTTDSHAAFAAALTASNFVLIPAGTYKISSTLTITGSKTLSGFDGGSQAFQYSTIYHDPASTGELFNVTSSEQEGICLKNFNVTGGNGSFCIVSSRSYVRYEYIHMEVYNGSGIQLLDTGIGSSSSQINNCQWVAPATPTAYTGFEINVNGGDVSLYRCTAIRGAIGINVIQGQTVKIVQCSLNFQAKTYGYSSAGQFNTCGIKLSSTDYKKAVSITESYIEACTNSIYVEACENLKISDNYIYDVGVSGADGSGNSLITLLDSNANNVTICDNYLHAASNGTVPNPYYALRFNSANNVFLLNNRIRTSGDNSGAYVITTSPTIYKLGNTFTVDTFTPVTNSDPSALMRDIISGKSLTWVTPSSYANSWVAGTIPAQYAIDAQGFVHFRGTVKDGTLGNAIFTLPPGYRPAVQASYLVNATAALGILFVTTDGDVILNAGTNTYVYLSGVQFETS